MDAYQALADITLQNGLALTSPQVAQLARYGQLLTEANAVVNLVSRKDEAHIATRHILHSLVLAMPGVSGFALSDGAAVLDLGCGGGLPGIPLGIVRPDLTLWLCDSIAKKIVAVQRFVSALQLGNVQAICARAESIENLPEHRHRYDVIVSRATAPLDDLVRWTRGLVKPGATLLALKGGDLSTELDRTRALDGVRAVTETSIRLAGWEQFALDDKKVVRVSV